MYNGDESCSTVHDSYYISIKTVIFSSMNELLATVIRLLKICMHVKAKYISYHFIYMYLLDHQFSTPLFLLASGLIKLVNRLYLHDTFLIRADQNKIATDWETCRKKFVRCLGSALIGDEVGVLNSFNTTNRWLGMSALSQKKIGRILL